MSDDARPQWDYIRDDGRTTSLKGWLWTIGAGLVWFGVMVGFRPQGVTVVRERLTQASPELVFQAFSDPERVSEWCGCGTLKILDLHPPRRIRLSGALFGKDQGESQNEILFFSEEKGTRVRWIWNARRSPLSATFRGIRASEQIVGPALEKALDRLVEKLD
jgi:uncharacterized protein YndB with AHSA1/START domain